jgi:hypothetical protein
MEPPSGRRWALVVFGTPALLVGLVAAGYAGAFLVPGGPCHGGGDLAPPDADVTVATNGSAVSAVLTNGSLGGPTTDRVRVFVEDGESDRRIAREWIGSNGSLERGDTFTLTGSDTGFALSDRDRVTVRWYGVDPDVAGFCPNGRTFRDLADTRVENASVAIDTGS